MESIKLWPCNTIDPSWLTEAEETAKKRRDYHSGKGSKQHWFDPQKGEYADEIYGSLGNIVFREFMKKAYPEVPCESAPLFTTKLKEMPDWDNLIDGKHSLEIKAIPPDDEKIKRIRLLVKKTEFKKLDFYLGVKFWDINTYSFCGLATGEQVAGWPSKSFGYSPAYWCLLSELPIKFEGKWWENKNQNNDNP